MRERHGDIGTEKVVGERLQHLRLLFINVLVPDDLCLMNLCNKLFLFENMIFCVFRRQPRFCDNIWYAF